MALLVLTRGIQCMKTGKNLLVYGRFTTIAVKSSYAQQWIPHCQYPLHYLQMRVLMKDTTRINYIKPRHATDGLSKEYVPIYNSASEKYFIFGIPLVFCFCTVLIILCCKTLYDFHVLGIKPSEIDFERFSQQDSIIMVYPIFLLVLGSAFFTMRLYRSVIVRLYHNPNTDKYVGVLIRVFGSKKFEFSLKDIKYDEKGLGFFRGNFIINGKRYIMTSEGFANMQHFNKFAGHSGEGLRDQPTRFEKQLRLARGDKSKANRLDDELYRKFRK